MADNSMANNSAFESAVARARQVRYCLLINNTLVVFLALQDALIHAAMS